MLSSQNPMLRTGPEASNINSYDTYDECGAMAKLKEVFVCQNCGAASPKWQGQCTACGEWNTLVGEAAPSAMRHPKPAPRAVRADSSTSLAAQAVAEQPRMATGSAGPAPGVGGGLLEGPPPFLGPHPHIHNSTPTL